jgi:transcription-repair coupling factor (superfamily II helicase)
LEIRGAGNILGAEQSGHIQLVGYQMYCELLAEAVRKLKNEPAEAAPAAAIDLGLAAYIPKSYIPADRYRMDVYRKIAVTKTAEDLKQMEGELADVYGPPPDEVKLLLELADIRIKASNRGIKGIVASGRDLIFSFTEDFKLEANSLFAGVKGTIRAADRKTVNLRLPENYFEPKTLMNVLRKILGANP